MQESIFQWSLVMFEITAIISIFVLLFIGLFFIVKKITGKFSSREKYVSKKTLEEHDRNLRFDLKAPLANLSNEVQNTEESLSTLESDYVHLERRVAFLEMVVKLRNYHEDNNLLEMAEVRRGPGRPPKVKVEV